MWLCACLVCVLRILRMVCPLLCRFFFIPPFVIVYIYTKCSPHYTHKHTYGHYMPLFPYIFPFIRFDILSPRCFTLNDCKRYQNRSAHTIATILSQRSWKWKHRAAKEYPERSVFNSSDWKRHAAVVVMSPDDYLAPRISIPVAAAAVAELAAATDSTTNIAAHNFYNGK